MGIKTTSSAERYAIVFLINPLEAGIKFERAGWPLHITIAPPFKYIPGLKGLDQTLANVLSHHRPCEVTVGREDLLGSRHDVPVVLVQPSDTLEKLRSHLYELLLQHGAIYVGPQHPFVPHITLRSHKPVQQGQTLHVGQLSIVELAPGDDESQAIVRGTVKL